MSSWRHGRPTRRPYYGRLAEFACGAVEVLTIEEALNLSRATVDGQTVVIVATIQSFRVEDTTGRKVYEQNGAFAEHLLNVPANRLTDLLPGADGQPKLGPAGDLGPAATADDQPP